MASDDNLDTVTVTVDIDARELTTNYLMDSLADLVDYHSQRRKHGASVKDLERVRLTIMHYRGVLMSLDASLEHNIESIIKESPVLATDNPMIEGDPDNAG